MSDQPDSPQQPDRVKFWTDIMERFERSDLPHAEFFRRAGIPASSFYTWRRRLRPDLCGARPARPPAMKAAKPASTFVELAVAQTSAPAPAGGVAADALAPRLDALDLILRGIRQLVLERP